MEASSRDASAGGLFAVRLVGVASPPAYVIEELGEREAGETGQRDVRDRVLQPPLEVGPVPRLLRFVPEEKRARAERAPDRLAGGGSADHHERDCHDPVRDTVSRQGARIGSVLEIPVLDGAATTEQQRQRQRETLHAGRKPL